MTNRLFKYLAVGALGAALALASPAMAFRGGMGGGGMHMGGMGGGMHFGGMGGGPHFGGMGGGPHFGAMGGPHFGAGFAGPRASFGAVRPGFSTFGRPGFAPAFHPGFNRFAFHNRFALNNRFFFHHHRRFAFVGAPFLFAGGFDSCWRRVWTAWGPRWVNVCADYGWW